jgi:hypothetical protein
VAISTVRPRIWVTPATLPALKAKAAAGGDRWNTLRQAADAASDWNSGIMVYSLTYLVTGNAVYAQRAWDLMAQSMQAGVGQVRPDSYYQARNYLPAASLVYDWLHDWMSQAQRQQLQADMEACVTDIWPETNPSRSTGWAIRDAENNYFYGFLLTWMAGLSLFGDSPLAQGFIDNARSKWTNLVLPVLAGPAAGGIFNEGQAYGVVSIMELLQSLMANLTATGEDLIATTPFFGEAVSALIHLTNPARTEIAPFGDLAAGPIADRHRIVMLMMAGHDPRCAGWLDTVALSRVSQRLNAAMEFLFYPAVTLPLPTVSGRKPAAGKRTKKGGAA